MPAVLFSWLVSFDETKIDQAQIETALGEAGYLGEMTMPEEIGVAAQWGEKLISGIPQHMNKPSRL